MQMLLYNDYLYNDMYMMGEMVWLYQIGVLIVGDRLVTDPWEGLVL